MRRCRSCTSIESREELTSWLSPFPAAASVESVSITRREVIGLPSRPDAGVGYYFSVIPFSGEPADWSLVLGELGSVVEPVVISVGLLPIGLPESYGRRLAKMAAFYSRLAREGMIREGVYSSRCRVAADPFAVDAEGAFNSYARRFSDRAFAMRITVASPRPPACRVVEAVAGAISRPDRLTAIGEACEVSLPSYELRRPSGEYERHAAYWNLSAIDFWLAPGSPQIWRRAEPPSSDLQLLCSLVDAREGARMLPVALATSCRPKTAHAPSHPATVHAPSHPATVHAPSHPATVHAPLHPAGEGAPHASMTAGTRAAYRLERCIGRGGMGEVYEAVQVLLDRRVALKLIAERFSSDECFRNRFEREAKLTAAIEHPNVLPVYECGELPDRRLFLAMRLVNGPDLGQLLGNQGPLGVADALDVLNQTADALDAAHREGLVHRDVKPANVLLESTGHGWHAYLADFGLAKPVDVTAELTRTGEFLGTIEYIAPERITGAAVDGRADVYSFGCLVYRCLTGEVPYRRATAAETLMAHANAPIPAPSDAVPSLPAVFDVVVAQAMEKDPEKRVASAGALMRWAQSQLDLEPAAAGEARR